MFELKDVLVVDRSAVCRDLVSRLLKPHCKRILSTDNIDRAIEIISGTPSMSLVIAEAGRDCDDGLRLLECAADREVRILLIAAPVTQKLEARAQRLGALGVLGKPVSFHAIAHALRGHDDLERSAEPRTYAGPPAYAVVMAEDGKSEQVRLAVYDLSESGALLATKGPLPIGTRLLLRLIFDDQSIALTARVVRIQEPNWRTLPGVGVVFEAVEREDRARLGRYVGARCEIGRIDEPI